MYPIAAYCELLHANNGGRFDHLNKPIFQQGVRSTCDVASDCGTCPIMRQWLAYLQGEGYEEAWECDKCVKETPKESRILKGFYQEGLCTRCGWDTPLLQLVLRKT